MKKILIISGAFLLGAFIFSLIGHEAIKMTSNDKFCGSCHEWMEPMVETYKKDIHGGHNKMGVKADCVSCHLPHDNLASYLVRKGINGVKEVSVMMFNDPKEMNWMENRKRREEYVYDSGCLSCHKDITSTKLGNPKAIKLHKEYKNALGTSEAQKCVSCHKNVGHDDLGKVLYEIKNPPVGEWDLKKFDKAK